MELISLIFLLLAAMFNSWMDAITHHYNDSIFSKRDRLFFDPSISWLNKYNDGIVSHGHIKWNLILFKINKPDFLTDAWHLFKFFMISCICAAIAMLMRFPIISFILLGTSWNIIFSLFYDHFLKQSFWKWLRNIFSNIKRFIKHLLKWNRKN